MSAQPQDRCRRAATPGFGGTSPEEPLRPGGTYARARGILACPRVVLLTPRGHSGEAFWRMLGPARALAARGLPVAWDEVEDAARSDVARRIAAADLLVLCQHHWPRAAPDQVAATIAAYHAAGIAVAGDYGDDIGPAADDFLAALAGRADVRAKFPSIPPLAHRLAVLRLLDGVTVTTPTLAARVRAHTTRPVLVVPNAIDLAHWRPAPHAAPRDPAAVTIGWLGSVRPQAEFAALAEAWRRCAARFPGVRFVTSDWPSAAAPPPPLAGAVPADRVRRVPRRTPAGVAGEAGQLDIGCCPLTDTPFNRGKSPIKAFEYAAAGAAVVASPLLYGAVIEHGVSGYLAATPDEWEAALARLIEDATHRHTLAANLLARVEREHTLEKNAWRWPAAWATIRADFAARQRGRLASL